MIWNNRCFYDDQVRARPMVQIKAMKTTQNVIGIGSARAGDRRLAQKRGAAILLYIMYEVSFDFLVMLIRRLLDLTAEEALVKCYGERQNKGENG